jgi:choice-of-anchor B domain-containing protein
VLRNSRRLWPGCILGVLPLGLAACGGGGGDSDFAPPLPPPPLGTGPASCQAGQAAGFPCDGISLLKRVPLAAMGGAAGNDIWGWVDSESGREYALVGLDSGTAFIDVSDPEQPVFLGRLPTRTVPSLWRDIKVYQDHAFVVADNAGAHGMQVFDLKRLRGVTAAQDFTADREYLEFGHAHNLAINEDTGFAYALGTDTCRGGLHMIDIGTPGTPLLAGCHDLAYTHDAHCVTYEGRHAEYAGREICVNANEDHVAIVDVTDKSAPARLARIEYPLFGYVHQGWLSEDHRYFLLGDERDEIRYGLPTRTHVFDLTRLDAPEHLYVYEAGTSATDHNLYIKGNRVYQANYTAGLRVLQFGDLSAGELEEVAYFDTHPASDSRQSSGAWSVYPFLPSGIVIVSDIEAGLFVLSVD